MSIAVETQDYLIKLDPNGESKPEMIRRIPLGMPTNNGGIAESELRDLLFRCPEALPIASIDPSYGDAMPVCQELNTAAGRVDALYLNRFGRLTVAEFKLWRNPQARREVIGQILDYAQAIAHWGYQDLERQVSLALKRSGREKFHGLFKLVCERAPSINEAEFVDSVTRHLKRGEFLLLIIGDGIREDVAKIVDFVQGHVGLHFNLAMVEAALYRDRNGRTLVQPRILARTEIVHRVLYQAPVAHDEAADGEKGATTGLSDYQRENLQFWDAVVNGFEFSDGQVDRPNASVNPTLSISVPGSGFNGWGLTFNGFLERAPQQVGCYLTCRPGISQAERIYGAIANEETLHDLRDELGSRLNLWTNPAGRPRIGFKRNAQFPLVSGGEESKDFRETVQWMRIHLDRLVSTLHPRLRGLLSKES